MSIPAFFVTTIHLSIPDRLRVLLHGTIIYRGEIEPDPGEFEISKVRVRIPAIIDGRNKLPHVGYEETYPNTSNKRN